MVNGGSRTTKNLIALRSISSVVAAHWAGPVWKCEAADGGVTLVHAPLPGESGGDRQIVAVIGAYLAGR